MNAMEQLRRALADLREAYPDDKFLVRQAATVGRAAEKVLEEHGAMMSAQPLDTLETILGKLNFLHHYAKNQKAVLDEVFGWLLRRGWKPERDTRLDAVIEALSRLEQASSNARHALTKEKP